MGDSHIHVKAVFFGVVIALTMPHIAGASPQSMGDSVAHRSFWVELGLGQGTMTSSNGLAWRAGFAYEIDRHVVSARIIEVSQVTVAGADPRFPQPDERATEVALMYGFDVSSKRDIFVLSVGIGYVHLRQRGNVLPNSPSSHAYEARTDISIGIAVDLLVLLPVSDRIAVGLSGAANFNVQAFVGGGMLTLAFGGFQ